MSGSFSLLTLVYYDYFRYVATGALSDAVCTDTTWLNVRIPSEFGRVATTVAYYILGDQGAMRIYYMCFQLGIDW